MKTCLSLSVSTLLIVLELVSNQIITNWLPIHSFLSEMVNIGKVDDLNTKTV